MQKQYREINSKYWVNCDDHWFDICVTSSDYDTRIIPTA